MNTCNFSAGQKVVLLRKPHTN